MRKTHTFEQKDIFLALAGSCIILLLVFILGVKVGKIFFSNEGLPSDEEILSIKPQKTSLTFPKALTSSGRYVDEVTPPKNLPIIASAPPPVVIAPVKKVTRTVKRSNKKRDKTAKYTVQIGSFMRMEDARRMQQQYKTFTPYIVKVRIKKGIRYRVRVGRYKTKKEGKKTLVLFARKHGIKNPLLIIL